MERDTGTPLEQGQTEELKLIGAMIAREEPLTAIEGRWVEFVEKSKDEIAESGIYQLIQHVLREAYLESNRDLQFYSEKIKHFNVLKEQIRDELERTRKVMDEYIKSLEENLSSVGDDAQLANIDLQSALQKQQQTLQTMSSVSKTLHDTGLGIIRKIG